MIPIFGDTDENRFDPNSLREVARYEKLVMTPDLLIGWAYKHKVRIANNPYFENPVGHPDVCKVKHRNQVPIYDSYKCLQELRHLATIEGVFYDKMPVFPMACRMEIKERKFHWTIPPIYVDAKEALKTAEGIRVRAWFATTELDGGTKLNEFKLDPKNVLCVSPFWNPGANTRIRDERIMHASFYFANAPEEVVAQHVDIFDKYWATAAKAEKAKAKVPPEHHDLVESVATKGFASKYRELMAASKETLRQHMIVETQDGPVSQAYPEPCSMPCTGPPTKNGVPPKLGWFTRQWMEGDMEYDAQDKREFQDLTDMLLAMTAPFDIPMDAATHIVSTVMPTTGSMAEFTAQMKAVFTTAMEQMKASDKQTEAFKASIHATMKECVSRMKPSKKRAVPVPIIEDALVTKRPCTGVPDK